MRLRVPYVAPQYTSRGVFVALGERVKPPEIAAPVQSRAEIENQWDLLVGREQRSVAEFKAGKAKLLIAARSTFDSRGDGFVEYVERRFETPYNTALRWMVDAGYVMPKKAGAGAKANHHQSGDEPPRESVEAIAQRLRSEAGRAARFEHEHEDVFRMAKNGYFENAALDIIETPPHRIVSETWAEDMESLAEQMIRAARQMFSAAEQLDALCRQREAAISSAKFASIPTHLLAAQASIASTLRIFKGESP